MLLSEAMKTLIFLALALAGCATYKGAGYGSKEDVYIPPEHGMAVVESLPADGWIYVNDALVGMTPQRRMFLKPGTYDLEIRKEGYKTWQEKILILENTRHDIRAILSGVGSDTITVRKKQQVY